ncbi:hypothetical protein ABIE41_002131 [Bosea sp. OAE506]|uniref:hypothetical protein n=1 Tax=Bosea sp. OAE506 TaxID=2663870 RepID=UPI00178AF5CC
MIIFEPWVGSRYRDQPVRLLLLGESHYGGDETRDPEPGSTNRVVAEWKSGGWAVRYLTTAARLITGKERWQIDKAADLEGIAFYNFVQVNVGDLRNRPTWAQFQASAPAFKMVLRQIDPTHVLATGKGLWDAMPNFDLGPGQDVDLAGAKRHIGRYETPSGSALATMIPHLSRGFSSPIWHGPVKAFLEMKP